MGANNEASGGTSPGESSQTTRQPTQLSVLLAGAGTPPLEAEQARQAPIRLWDAFVLGSDRIRLFTGDPRSLFGDRPVHADPRHDALARIVRTLAAAFRQRLVAYDQSHVGSELLRGVPALAPLRIEGALLGFDLRRGASASDIAATFLGSTVPDVDPVDAADAGILRRFVALTTRGLMIEKGARGGGAIADLGAVTLGLGVLDLLANPRSALRAARVRLAKTDRIDHRGFARVRDVGQALRELLSHAVSSATTAGSAARDLVKEAILGPDAMDHLAVALARAVYDGFAPIEEHPLVVGGAGASEAFTVAPMLIPAIDDEIEPWLGLYNRIGFLSLPYLPLDAAPHVGAPPLPRTSAPLDDASFVQAREALRNGVEVPRPDPMFVVDLDAARPEGRWTRTGAAQLGETLVDRVEVGAPGTHVAILVGPRGGTVHTLLDAIAESAQGDEGEQGWCVLTPRPADRTLVFERLESSEMGGLQLRRADLSRWLDAEPTRIVQWDLAPGARVVINAAALGEADSNRIAALFELLRDVAERGETRGVLLLVGSRHVGDAAEVMRSFARDVDLERGPVPVRTGAITLARTDAPLASRGELRRSADEAMLAHLAEALAPPSIADLAARSALLPTAGHASGRRLRLAALPAPIEGGPFSRATLARASAEPWSGLAARRMFQSGVATSTTARAAMATGDVGGLASAVRHEVGLLLATWEGAGERPTAARLADVGRGLLVEFVAAAHPRVAWIVGEALAAVLGTTGDDPPVSSATADSLHGSALGLRCAGSVHAPVDAAGTVPIGFVLKGGAELFVYADVHASGAPGRLAPVPHLELTFRPTGERTAGIGLAALLVSALHESVRRFGADAPLRAVGVDGRTSFAALLDVSIDARMVLEGVRVAVPLRANLAEGDAQQLALDVASALADATDTRAASEWNVQLLGPGKSPAALPLAGPLVLREMASRWNRALRVLARTFPVGARGSARYARTVALASAAELGIASALLRERGVVTTGVQGRAVISRAPSIASEVIGRARELAATIPVRAQSLEGNDLDVLERILAVAWFLHANFCCIHGGSLQWAPGDAPEMSALVQQHLDRAALKIWLQRKTSRPETVERRVAEALEALEPRVVVAD